LVLQLGKTLYLRVSLFWDSTAVMPALVYTILEMLFPLHCSSDTRAVLPGKTMREAHMLEPTKPPLQCID